MNVADNWEELISNNIWVSQILTWCTLLSEPANCSTYSRTTNHLWERWPTHHSFIIFNDWTYQSPKRMKCCSSDLRLKAMANLTAKWRVLSETLLTWPERSLSTYRITSKVGKTREHSSCPRGDHYRSTHLHRHNCVCTKWLQFIQRPLLLICIWTQLGGEISATSWHYHKLEFSLPNNFCVGESWVCRELFYMGRSWVG